MIEPGTACNEPGHVPGCPGRAGGAHEVGSWTVLIDPNACEVCHRTAERRHPCRFEVGCSCWRGIPCDGSGKVR